jgi:hypothetical protein
VNEDGVRRKIKTTFPGFGDLKQDHQRELVRSVTIALVSALADHENQSRAPRLATLQMNIGNLAKALEAVRSARKSLDLISRSTLIMAAGESQPGDGKIYERGSQRWAHLDESVRTALHWTERALAVPPRSARKKAPTDRLIERLSKLFIGYQSPRDKKAPSRSTKKGGFVPFANAVMSCVEGLPDLNDDKIQHALRRVQEIARQTARSRRQFGIPIKEVILPD